MDAVARLEVHLPVGSDPARLRPPGPPEQERRAPRHAAQALQELHDPLTGLAGPALALDRLVQSTAGLARSSHGLLLLCVVVQADSAGAEQSTLLRAATRLGDAVRPGDTVARWDGNTLLALCHRLEDLASAQRLRGRAAAALPRPDEAVRSTVGLSGAVLWDRLSEQQLLTLAGELVGLARGLPTPHPLLEVSCA